MIGVKKQADITLYVTRTKYPDGDHITLEYRPSKLNDSNNNEDEKSARKRKISAKIFTQLVQSTYTPDTGKVAYKDGLLVQLRGANQSTADQFMDGLLASANKMRMTYIVTLGTAEPSAEPTAD